MPNRSNFAKYEEALRRQARVLSERSMDQKRQELKLYAQQHTLNAPKVEVSVDAQVRRDSHPPLDLFRNAVIFLTHTQMFVLVFFCSTCQLRVRLARKALWKR